MWILSIAHADKHDGAMVERWKADMDGILIYVRFKKGYSSWRRFQPFYLFENGL